jgi:hypothetical protein
MEGCKQKQGMCIHEKMMMVIVVVAMIAGAIYFLR